MHLTRQDLFAPILAAAERLLSKEFGREVRLGDAARLSEDGRRNLLLRFRDLSGGFPASFLIKKVVVDTYDPEDRASWDIRRFFSDWVGAQFLSAIPDSPHSPAFTVAITPWASLSLKIWGTTEAWLSHSSRGTQPPLKVPSSSFRLAWRAPCGDHRSIGDV
jgi:hypothetical protein